MKKFGLIGYPLGHSFSEKYFTEKFNNLGLIDHCYKLYPIEVMANGFPKLLEENPLLCGINVTIPHKIEVMGFLDEIDEAAAAIGAVNCIKITRTADNKKNLKGYNTDAYGFESSIKPFLEPHHKKALILGNGGAAKAVKYVLGKLGIEYKFVSRNPKEGMLSYADLTKEILEDYHIIINSSPVGTYPNVTEKPELPYEFISDKHLFYDLIYNPAETVFLAKGREKGAKTKNGYEMLELQAEKSWEIWNE
ncbi:shikimate dehydrogenase [Pseudopedobacter saltans DSM 12145]|uniref:Shikimate dehydrogenase n=1 Tax=Pseudopedobacter saltans (strain ATCC 51119 / DSM 12145 / JCM 21818 / CCUG 39354 / LMG 10337 / NBRC 100064 / NCIMB 13643) TaxID=762903 RepID=F0S9M1_PSESL|nr:shikimate dehydrogenase [Pseudopedobacter saltans]ADY53574.1 shikimate dehydrogenase [Pseudopedobacter saltans DSM 12145]